MLQTSRNTKAEWRRGEALISDSYKVFKFLKLHINCFQKHISRHTEIARYSCELYQVDKYRLQATQVRNNYIRLYSIAPILTAHSNFSQSSPFPGLTQNTSEEMVINSITSLKGYKTLPTKLRAQNGTN